MGQRKEKKESGRERRGWRWGERERDEVLYSLVPSFSSSLCLLPLSVSLPDLCGHCWGGLTGACSNTISVTQGEEWPPFPLRSLSSPPGRRACLFVLPDIGRHLNSPVKHSTMRRDETNSWRMRPEVPPDIAPSHGLRICGEHKYYYETTNTSAKTLCHVMRLERERDGVRDIGGQTKSLVSPLRVWLLCTRLAVALIGRPNVWLNGFSSWVCVQVCVQYPCYHIHSFYKFFCTQWHLKTSQSHISISVYQYQACCIPQYVTFPATRPELLTCCFLEENNTHAAARRPLTLHTNDKWATHECPSAQWKSLSTTNSCIIYGPSLLDQHGPPYCPPPFCSSEGPLIRVICVSHHLVSLRTHWRLVDSSLRPAWCFCFWCGFFIWPFWNWGHFLETGDRMLFLTVISSVLPTVWECGEDGEET